MSDWDDLKAAIVELAANPSKTTEVDPITKQDVKDRHSNRLLREDYAKRWARIAAGILIVMNVVFIATGAGLLHYKQWVLELYVSSTIGEVLGIVLVITRYLFPRRDNG